MEPIDLSDFFTTKAEANDFLSRLTSIEEMFFRTNFNFKQALTQQLGVTKADRFLTIMRENNVNPESLPVVKEFVTILAQKIISMPVITLTVAFEPKEQTLKNLSGWFVVNMKKQLLFDIKIDRNIIAGATITFNGKFSDFSIRENFNQVLKTALNNLNNSDKPALTLTNQVTQQTHPNAIPIQPKPSGPPPQTPATPQSTTPPSPAQQGAQQTKN